MNIKRSPRISETVVFAAVQSQFLDWFNVIVRWRRNSFLFWTMPSWFFFSIIYRDSSRTILKNRSFDEIRQENRKESNVFLTTVRGTGDWCYLEANTLCADRRLWISLICKNFYRIFLNLNICVVRIFHSDFYTGSCWWYTIIILYDFITPF